MKQALKILISLMLLAATVFLVEWLVGWQLVLRNIFEIPTTAFALLLVTSLMSYMLRAWRIRFAITQAQSLPFLQLLSISAYHTFLNNLLPMRTGEISFPLLLRQHCGTDILTSSAYLLLFRLLDLVSLVFIVSSIVVWDFYPALTLPLVVVWLCLPYLFIRLMNLLVGLGSKSGWIMLNELAKKLGSLSLTGDMLQKIALVSLLIWGCKIFGFVSLVLVFVDLSLPIATTAVIAAELSSVLPIHGFAGTGTYEGAFVLAASGLSEYKSMLLLAAVKLHMYLLLMSFVFCGLFSLVWGIQRYFVGRYVSHL